MLPRFIEVRLTTRRTFCSAHNSRRRFEAVEWTSGSLYRASNRTAQSAAHMPNVGRFNSPSQQPGVERGDSPVGNHHCVALACGTCRPCHLHLAVDDAQAVFHSNSDNRSPCSELLRCTTALSTSNCMGRTRKPSEPVAGKKTPAKQNSLTSERFATQSARQC